MMRIQPMIKLDGLRIYDGAVAIVTGGASGMGECFAVELAARGASVVIADLDGELAAKVATGIREGGGDATHVKLDVSDHVAVKTLVEDTVTRHGRLDFMFNLVGIIYSGSALDHSIEDWYRVLDVGIRGVVNGVDAAYPVMVEQGFGHIVNMSSIEGLVPFYNVPYSATRFAVVGLSLTLRAEASLHGVRVTLLCPGAVSTLTFEESGKFGKRLRDIPDDLRSNTLKRLHPIAPRRLVLIALRRIARNRAIVVAPFRTWYIWRSYGTSPHLSMHIMHKYFIKPLFRDTEKYVVVDSDAGSDSAGDSAT
jgi:NAD(P)-dependent dehydrogenase (short-subunit alcohol dehydrogenase family)